MRFLCLAVGSMGLFACGIGHSSSLDVTDASTPDGGSHASPDAAPGPPIDATSPGPAACSSDGSYPIAPCGDEAPPGMSPSPACPLAHERCAPTSSCAIDESTCGSASTCLPTANNFGTTWDYRVRRLAIQAPASLANAFVQHAIFDDGIDLDAPQCGETGNGGLNWLMRFDGAANTLTTGGAPPSKDPLHAGFCFVHVVEPGFTARSQTTCITSANGTTQSGIIDSLYVPIFLNGNVTDPLFLPLHRVQLSSVHLSPDHACIGSIHRNALDAQCTYDETTCEKWKTDGAVAGYITLEEADATPVVDLNESLCVLLTETSKGPDGKCARDAAGNIVSRGDYCATSRSPGGCADSVWFGATFAASAVTINDGSSDPSCR